MSEKTEWEIVDAAAPDVRAESQANGQHDQQYREQFRARYSAQSGARPDMQQSLKALLGPWWRWKLAGAAVTLAVVLALVATVAGAVLLVVTAAAIASFGIAKVRQWLRRETNSA